MRCFLIRYIQVNLIKTRITDRLCKPFLDKSSWRKMIPMTTEMKRNTNIWQRHTKLLQKQWCRLCCQQRINFSTTEMDLQNSFTTDSPAKSTSVDFGWGLRKLFSQQFSAATYIVLRFVTTIIYTTSMTTKTTTKDDRNITTAIITMGLINKNTKISLRGETGLLFTTATDDDC